MQAWDAPALESEASSSAAAEPKNADCSSRHQPSPPNVALPHKSSVAMSLPVAAAAVVDKKLCKDLLVHMPDPHYASKDFAWDSGFGSSFAMILAGCMGLGRCVGSLVVVGMRICSRSWRRGCFVGRELSCRVLAPSSSLRSGRAREGGNCLRCCCLSQGSGIDADYLRRVIDSRRRSCFVRIWKGGRVKLATRRISLGFSLKRRRFGLLPRGDRRVWNGPSGGFS